MFLSHVLNGIRLVGYTPYFPVAAFVGTGMAVAVVFTVVDWLSSNRMGA